MNDFIHKKSVITTIVPDALSYNKWTHIAYVHGTVLSYLEGASLPMKTAPTPDAAWAMNIVKKTLIESIKVFPFSLSLKFIHKKSLTKLLESFNRIGYGVMEPYMYYVFFHQGPLQLTSTARGVGKLVETFLETYGISQETAHHTAELIAHIFEYDSFYRFKLMDIMKEAQLLHMRENPRKEIQRLIAICYDREKVIPTYIRPKLKILSRMAWVLAWPPLKRVVQKTFIASDFSLFEIDEIDYYSMLRRYDYHYFGLSFEERMKIFKEKGWTEPTEYGK